MSIRYIRRVNGRVVEKGSCPADNWEAFKAQAPAELFEDANNEPMAPAPAPTLPPVLASRYPSVEELTDALLKHLDGDVSAFTAIRAKLKK